MHLASKVSLVATCIGIQLIKTEERQVYRNRVEQVSFDSRLLLRDLFQALSEPRVAEDQRLYGQ